MKEHIAALVHQLAGFKDQMAFLAYVVGGVIVSVICSDKVSFWQAFARVVCGVVLSSVFTDPFLAIMNYDPEVYRNSVASLFGMCGYAVARVLVNVDRATILKAISSVTGKK